MSIGPLPDMEFEPVTPHPSGVAWRKACDECAFRRHDPQDMGDGYQEALRRFDGATAFYCIHRLDDDCNRVCACFAAINKFERQSP